MVAGIDAGGGNQTAVSQLLSLSYRHPQRLGTGRAARTFYFRKKTTPVYNFEKNYQL
jgi:hypothetical protein